MCDSLPLIRHMSASKADSVCALKFIGINIGIGINSIINT